MTTSSFHMHRRSHLSPSSSSPPRRDSEMSITPLPPPSAGKTLRYFLVLPTSILDLICVYLDGNDVKNLSLTCFGMLDKIELTRELCPRIRVLNIQPRYQVQASSRILSASFTETDPLSQHQYLLPEKDEPPEYSQLSRAAYHNSFRIQRIGPPITVQTWLCPHVGLTASEAFLLRKQHPICEGRVRDTTAAICPFPKCSLWARHALVESSGEEKLFELSSAIKVCRFSCKNISSARTVLNNQRNRNILHRAMQHLDLPLCTHHLMCDEKVLHSFDPNSIAVLDAHAGASTSTSASTLTQLDETIDRHRCDYCQAVGTFTTWGFTSRFTSEANGNWLDIELMLCRPLYSSDSVGSPRGIHWRHHSARFPQTPKYVENWWKWAEVVAEAGFDWRACLPAQFLLRSHGQLTAFPARPPRYSDLVGTLLSIPEKVKSEKVKFTPFTRRRPRQVLGIA